MRANLSPNSPMSPPLTCAWLPGISRFSKSAVAFDLPMCEQIPKLTRPLGKSS
jgi:hypothetical protein